MEQYHIKLSEGQVGRYVFLPGDPARSELIAKRFDNPSKVAQNREFTTYTGELDGEKVSVCSTGVGSPSSAIAMEELCNIGADTFVRVGTAGGVAYEMKFGQLLVVSAAVRAEGTSRAYAPIEFPAVADLDLSQALLVGAQEVTGNCRMGVSLSIDGFYPRIQPLGTPLEELNLAREKAWRLMGTLGVEMECAALYIVAAKRRVRASGIMVIVDEAGVELEVVPQISLDPLIDSAILGIRKMIAIDRASGRLS